MSTLQIRIHKLNAGLKVLREGLPSDTISALANLGVKIERVAAHYNEYVCLLGIFLDRTC